MKISNRQLGTICRSLISIGIAALAIFAAAPALADLARVDCSYQYGLGPLVMQSGYQDGATSASSSVSCNGAFGTVSSSATVSGTSVGAYIGIDWNGNPSPVPEASAMALAILQDSMFVPGTGRGTMTFSVPVHGLFAESAYFSLFVSLVLQAGDYIGDNSNIWQTYYDASVGQTYIVPLSIPLGSWFNLNTQLQIWGATMDGHGAPFYDGVADFSHTVGVSITRLQDANGGDIPLTALIVPSGREFTPTAAIPEPESYAMLLAGLGLLGFIVRRRAC